MWFASWSTERPIVEPGTYPPLVVGVTTETQLPAGATLLASGGKDPPPPPPPPPSLVNISMSDYEKSIAAWLDSRDEDDKDESRADAILIPAPDPEGVSA
ncbi:MAG: hypothetical protein E6J91_39270 [Deltaproteobacteria bacterium]|nr:MAG: hypothetical protein E6J91_39270 [Deltaproteobacteria bacterium]